MDGFQRARSEEQREARRRTILQTATAMLDEMPVAAISLNELSRRVGLAKSNVLRYFSSREAILLEILAERSLAFRAELAERLPATVDPAAPAPDRARATAQGLAASFAADPMLCELLSAQADVLEQNIPDAFALRFKQDARTALDGLAALLRTLLPELDARRSEQAAITIVIHVSGLWRHVNPSPAVKNAYAADPTLDFLPLSFADALEQATTAFLLGLLATSPSG